MDSSKDAGNGATGQSPIGIALKVYIGAPYGHRHLVQMVAKQLHDMMPNTVQFTSRWHNSGLKNTMDAGVYLLGSIDQDARRIAQQDLEDIDAADVFLAMTVPDKSDPAGWRGGRHVEYGYALGKSKRIVLYGPREATFYHLDVYQCHSVSALVPVLGQIRQDVITEAAYDQARSPHSMPGDVSQPYPLAPAVKETATPHNYRVWHEDARRVHDHFTNQRPMMTSERLRFLALAIAGEAGELANLIKKEWRGDVLDFRQWLVDKQPEIGAEMADIMLYMNHMANLLSLDLEEEIVKKTVFNLKRWEIQGTQTLPGDD